MRDAGEQSRRCIGAALQDDTMGRDARHRPEMTNIVDLLGRRSKAVRSAEAAILACMSAGDQISERPLHPVAKAAPGAVGA
jgi:hypothetical protein